MKKTPLRRCGKVGEANIKSRKMIATKAEEEGLDFCELKFEGCLHKMYLAPAHRHSRSWYKGDADLLADFQQWVVACQNCHQILDGRSTTSQEESDAIFLELRGEE